METILIVLTRLVLLHTVTGSFANIAQGKPVSASSLFEGFSADTAVDGNNVADDWDPSKIIFTARGQAYAWFEVDLQREVQDATVRIYFRTDYTLRRNGVKLYTSTSTFSSYTEGQLCKEFTSTLNGTDIADVYNATCAGRWRYLLFYTNTDNNGQGAMLDFGEVQVFACRDNLYGPDCIMSCTDRKCIDNSSSCNHVTGRCDGGCLPGYKDTVDCTEECDSGFYGTGCNYVCSGRHCRDPSSRCQHVTGQCEGGCQLGFVDIDCRLTCTVDEFGNLCPLCDIRHCQGESDCPPDGACSQGCLDGYIGPTCTEGQYGPGCNMTCGNCRSDDACHHVTGNCSNGCTTGWMSTKCDLVDIKTEDPTSRSSVSTIVGAVVGTLLVVVLLLVVIFACLLRQGRLQCEPLQWSRDRTQRSSHDKQPDSTQIPGHDTQPHVSENVQGSSYVYNDDYAALDMGTRADHKDYDVIQQRHYQNILQS